MSKKIIALALAALAPAAAMAADSNVTIYGIIDYGFVSRTGDKGDPGRLKGGRSGSLNEFAGGISAGNRIGFKGSEDLGNGLKAIFEIEFGFKGDDTRGTTFNYNRHSWVGLTGGFGTVIGGRVDGARYSFVGKYDPFKNQTVANAATIFGYTSHLGQADRADNAIVYISPSFGGFKVLGAYTKSLLQQEGISAPAGQKIKVGDSPLWAIAGMYDNGPLSVTLDYEQLKIYSPSGIDDAKWHIMVAGASYDFGVAKLSGYYERTKGKGLADGVKGHGWLLGVSAPIGPVTVMASYVDGRDKSDDGLDRGNCKKFGIGAEYALSKRTALYTTYARINNNDISSCAITLSGSAGGGNAAASAAGSTVAYGRSGFDLGIRHAF